MCNASGEQQPSRVDRPPERVQRRAVRAAARHVGGLQPRARRPAARADEGVAKEGAVGGEDLRERGAEVGGHLRAARTVMIGELSGCAVRGLGALGALGARHRAWLWRPPRGRTRAIRPRLCSRSRAA